MHSHIQLDTSVRRAIYAGRVTGVTGDMRGAREPLQAEWRFPTDIVSDNLNVSSKNGRGNGKHTWVAMCSSGSLAAEREVRSDSRAESHISGSMEHDPKRCRSNPSSHS